MAGPANDASQGLARGRVTSPHQSLPSRSITADFSAVLSFFDTLDANSAPDDDQAPSNDSNESPQPEELDPQDQEPESQTRITPQEVPDSDADSDDALSTIAPSTIFAPDPQDLPSYIDRELIAEWVKDKDITPQSRLARRIVTITRLGLISCYLHAHHTPRPGTRSRHRTSSPEASSETGPCGLAELTRHMTKNASWKKEVKGIGLDRQEPLSHFQQRFPSRNMLPNRNILEAIACGTPHEPSSSELNVSLEVDHDADIHIHRAKFDVDSFLNIIQDIQAFKDSIEYTPIRQPLRKLHGSVHITYPIENPTTNRLEDVQLHRIPHIYFGSSQGQTIYIFFPGIYHCTKSRPSSQNGATQLTEDEHRMFYDKIMIPSVRKTFPESMMGHIALTYQDIRNKAGFSRNASSRSGLPPYGFPLPSSLLPRLSESLKSTLANLSPIPDSDDPEDDKVSESMLKDFFFLLDTKNTKVRHGGARDIESCISNFWTKQRHVVEPSTTHNAKYPQFLDIAAEWSPGARETATILLARRCCQVNTLRFLYGQVDDALWAAFPPLESTPLETHKITGGQHHYYNVNLLRDSVSLTTEPASELRRHGLHYFQSYTVGKEVLDAAGKKPYSSEALLHGGYSDSVMVRMISKSSEAVLSRKHFDQLLFKSHRFFEESVKSNVRRHFSWRAEWRCTNSLARLVGIEDTNWLSCNDFTLPAKPPNAPPHDPAAEDPSTAAEDPSSARRPRPVSNAAFYCIPSLTYWRFVHRSIGFYTYVMDLISIHHRGETVPPTASLLYATLVTLARSFIDPINPRFRYVLMNPHNLHPVSGPVPHTPGAERKRGLGLLANIERQGFGFIPKRVINWENLRLHLTMESDFSIPGLRTSVGKTKYLAIKDSPESLFSLLLHLLATNKRSAKVKVILTLISHLILRRYRKAALESMIFKNRPKEQQQRIDRDTIPFTFPGLQHYITECGQLAIKSGSNRTVKWRTLDQFWEFTWEDLPHDPSIGATRLQPQTTFKDNDWRRFWRSARDAIAARVRDAPKGSADWVATFEAKHRELFFTHHTTFPYPAENGGLSKQGNAPSSRALLCTVVDPRGVLKVSMNPKEDPRADATPIPTCYSEVWTANDVNRLVDAAR